MTPAEMGAAEVTRSRPLSPCATGRRLHPAPGAERLLFLYRGNRRRASDSWVLTSGVSGHFGAVATAVHAEAEEAHGVTAAQGAVPALPVPAGGGVDRHDQPETAGLGQLPPDRHASRCFAIVRRCVERAVGQKEGPAPSDAGEESSGSRTRRSPAESVHVAFAPPRRPRETRHRRLRHDAPNRRTRLGRGGSIPNEPHSLYRNTAYPDRYRRCSTSLDLHQLGAGAQCSRVARLLARRRGAHDGFSSD